MTSRLVVNNIDNDTGVTTIRLNPTYSSFELNSAERLRIESSGRIGINTTSSRVNGVHIYDKHLAVTEGYPITWLQPNSASSRGRMTVDSGGNYLFQFGSSNDEKIRFKSDGKIGIGTDNPSTEVHLYGDAPVLTVTPTNWQSGLRLNVVGLGYVASNNQLFRVQRDGTTKLQLNEDGDLVITGDDNAELKLKCGTSSGNAVIAFLNSSGSTKGNIFYDSDNNFMVFKTNGTAGANERVRITSSGNVNLNENVGIQTSSVEGADLVGAGTSFFGAYIGDGMLAFHNRLDNSAGYYVAAHVNALNAGPVTLGSTMTLAGTWVIV